MGRASQQDVINIKAVFAKADQDGDGFISREELLSVFRSLMACSDAEFDTLYDAADKNKDGKLSYDEFVDWMFCSGAGEPFRLSDPDDVFRSCDTDLSGKLDMFETRFALQAFGIFLTKEEVELELADKEAFSHSEFRAILKQMQQDRSKGERRPFYAVPYSKRGLSLAQLTSLQQATLDTGYLEGECLKFNSDNAADIEAKKKFSMALNLYAMNTCFVIPVTAVGSVAVPEVVRIKAGAPQAVNEASYSELINPNGVDVHFFVSHYWGHLFQSTMKSLCNHAAAECGVIKGKSADDLVYWVCVFALNQHRPGEEVGSTPEEGPFNAALAKASNGAIMILDEGVEPFSRIWCLFEVHKMGKLNYELVLVGEDGPLNPLNGAIVPSASAMAAEACRSLVDVSAFKAQASSEDDLFAIWYRIGSWKGWSFEGMKGVAKGNDLLAGSYEDFDVRIGQALALPVLRNSLREENAEQALCCLGLGAKCGRKVLLELEALGVDLKTARSPVSKFDSGGEKGLVSVMSFFGHHQGLRLLLERGASTSDSGNDGRHPLHQAAKKGQIEAAKVLIEFGATVDQGDEYEWQPIHEAAQAGSSELVQLFAEQGAEINCADSDGRSPLSCAVAGGQLEMAQYLLDCGADLAMGDMGSCIHCAAMGFQPECVKLLIERGAREEDIKELNETMGEVMMEDLDEPTQARCIVVQNVLSKASASF